MHILRFLFFVIDIVISLKNESNEFDEIGSIVFLHNIGGESWCNVRAFLCIRIVYILKREEKKARALIK